MFRKDHKDFTVIPGFSVGDDALMNLKESLALRDKIKEKQRELMIQEEWCADYCVSQLQKMHQFFIPFSYDTYSNFYYTWSKRFTNLNLSDTDKDEFHIHEQIFAELFFGKEYSKKVKLVRVMGVLDCSSFTFWYKYNNKEVGIEVPMYCNATFDNYLSMKYRIRDRVDEYNIGLIASGYEFSEVKQKLYDFLFGEEEKDKKGE